MSAEDFMRRAIALAAGQAASGKGGPFGAVIVRDGRIIAEGANRVTADHDPSAHAEIVAIRAACAALETFTLAGCEIYASCEPCPMCLGAIYWARLDRLHFGAGRLDAAAAGFDDAFLYEQLPLPIEARTLPTDSLLADEATEAFTVWAATQNRVLY